jgi:hypothetical protein
VKVLIDGVQYVPLRKPVNTEGIAGALDVRIEQSDAGDNITVRDYLRILLETLWDKGESFGGKRPFGNSNWEYELYRPLVDAGYIKGQIGARGVVTEVDDESDAHAFVARLIAAAFKSGGGVKE